MLIGLSPAAPCEVHGPDDCPDECNGPRDHDLVLPGLSKNGRGDLSQQTAQASDDGGPDRCHNDIERNKTAGPGAGDAQGERSDVPQTVQEPKGQDDQQLMTLDQCLGSQSPARPPRPSVQEGRPALPADEVEELIPQDRNGGMAEAAVVAQVRANAVTLRAWADTATINALAYLFGQKEILASATWYRHIRRNATSAEEDARRAATRPAIAAGLLVDQCNRIVILKAVKDGVAPPE
jgi:hypothetical protein